MLRFFVWGFGRKILLLISILASYVVLFVLAALVDVLTGVNVLNRSFALGGLEVDSVVVVGVAGAVAAALLYRRLLTWVEKRLARTR
jgi:hypothetical protein